MPVGTMPGKNFIVRMADRLRAGHAGDTAPDRDPAHDFASRQHTLAALAARLNAEIATNLRYAGFKCSSKPDRIQLRKSERIVTLRISPQSEYFAVSGSSLGRRFSANPAHMQSDDVVLLSAQENGSHAYGTEFTALDFLEDLTTL